MVKSTIKAKGLNDMGLSRIDALGQDRYTPPYNTTIEVRVLDIFRVVNRVGERFRGQHSKLAPE